MAIFSSILYPQQNNTLSVNYKIQHINPPVGFQRVLAEKNSFARWLRNRALKSPNSPVLDYTGKIIKTADDTTVAAVINWNIRNKRLDQCMDVIVRFYAEYLWDQGKTNELTLPLPGGYWLDWQSWKQGWRPIFNGIEVTMTADAKPDSAKQNYDKYLNVVFAESGTQQFYYRYKTMERQKVRIGDFIVKKGIKSHAVLIVDLAKNSKGKMVALIGQGDTPACEFYLLNYRKKNPWFPLDFSKDILPLPIRKKITWEGLRRFQRCKEF